MRGIQQRLERFYGLEHGPNITDFVRTGSASSREVLLLRHGADGLELALMLPSGAGSDSTDDVYLQVIEGVSHFVYIAERARVDLPATKLELELQAEVDKFVLLAFEGGTLMRDRAHAIRRSLYSGIEFLDAAALPGRKLAASCDASTARDRRTRFAWPARRDAWR